MDNKKEEVMDTLAKIFSDEASVETLMKAETVEEIENIMENKGVSFTRKDCEFLLAVKDKNFVRSLTEINSNEEVQTVLEEKGFTLSLDECAIFRIMANKSIMESLAKAKNTEEVRNILEENGITLTPEAYSNLEWNLEVDVELSEDELSDVAGGDGWLGWLGAGLAVVGAGSWGMFALGVAGTIVMTGLTCGAWFAAGTVAFAVGTALVLIDKES